jgi:methyl-accepting chemotaxis protein
MRKRSTLERQMLTYFGLIAAASLLITMEFIWAVRAAMFQAEALAHASSAPERAGGSVMLALQALQNKALLMFIVQAVVTLIVLVMLIRRITGPLQQMVEQSRLISEGDLSRTILIRRPDEIGMLGETINGLTSNIQEIVAFGLSTDSSVRQPLRELRVRWSDDPESRRQLDEIEERLAGFRSILEGFTLLPAPLAETKADDK